MLEESEALVSGVVCTLYSLDKEAVDGDAIDSLPVDGAKCGVDPEESSDRFPGTLEIAEL